MGGAALFCAHFLLPGRASVVASGAVPILSMVAVLAGIRAHRPARPVVWYLFGVSIPLFAVTGLLHELAPGGLAGRPALDAFADGMSVAAFGALLAGVACSGHAMHARESGDDVLDAGVVLIAAAAALRDLVYLPLAHATRLPGIEAAMGAAVPAAGMLLMAVAVHLIAATPDVLWPLWAVEAGAAAMIAGFSLGALGLAWGRPGNVPLLVAGWMATSLLIALPALHPSMRRIADAARAHPDNLGRRRTATLGLALLVPAGATVIAVRVLHQPFVPRTLLLPSAAVTALVLLRLRQLFASKERIQQHVVLRERRFRLLVENLTDHVVVVGGDGLVRYQSPSLTRLLGYAADELVGQPVGRLLPDGEHVGTADLAAESRAAGGAPVRGLVRALTAAGEPRSCEATVTDLVDDPAVAGVVVVIHDVTERERFEAELRRQALHDPLTGLPNRALVLDRANRMLAAVRRTRTPVAALFVDLDNFKVINDSLGHAAGDELLRAVAARLLGAVRESDTVGRLGGDEFVVLLDGAGAGAAPGEQRGAGGGRDRGRASADAEEDVRPTADPSRTPEAVAGRLLEVLRSPIAIGERAYTPSASIGVAVRTGGSGEELLRDADISMYRAKARGKNRVVVFQPQMQLVAQERLELETDLRAALAARELSLVYQPAVDLRDLRVTGMEALARWTHPVRGPIAPSVFVPLAEDAGLAAALGLWVLRKACREAAAWQPTSPGLAVSVNVSGRQIDTPDLVEDVRSALQDSGLPAGLLVLEITETALMRDAAEAARRVRALKALGVRVAIDDFGTGYSSLSYLRQFPVDVLKIDRSFIRTVQDSAEAVAVVRTLVELGKTLNLEVVAEGVEIEAQLDALQRQRCDTAQGYLFARPLAAEHLHRFLEQWALGSPHAPATRLRNRRRPAGEAADPATP